MNLANKITMGRIFLVPVFMVFLLIKIPYGEFIAAIIFIIAASTDGLDGYIARTRKEVTRFGKFVDPLADKLLVTAALISLVEIGLVPAWIAILIIAREFAVTGLRAIAAAEGIVISASNLGKIKTISQIVAISAILLNDLIVFLTRGLLADFGTYLLYIALIFTIWSGIHYFKNAWSALKFSKM